MTLHISLLSVMFSINYVHQLACTQNKFPLLDNKLKLKIEDHHHHHHPPPPTIIIIIIIIIITIIIIIIILSIVAFHFFLPWWVVPPSRRPPLLSWWPQSCPLTPAPLTSGSPDGGWCIGDRAALPGGSAPGSCLSLGSQTLGWMEWKTYRKEWRQETSMIPVINCKNIKTAVPHLWKAVLQEPY